MEIVILLVILVILIIKNSDFSSKLKNIETKVNLLNNQIQHQTDLLEKRQTNVLLDSSLPPIVETPEIIVEDLKPIVEEVVLPISENGSPQVEEILPIVEEKIDEKVETPEIAFTIEAPQPVIVQKSWFEKFKEKNPDLEKFIGENLINKIGMLILVLGISYFVKYSIDKGWISEPARVGIGILSGTLVLGIAHRLRKQFAAFSSVIVAGAIAIYYFTIAIAFHDYQLISQTVAFVIMVLITAFSCFISLAYDRKELAVLSLIGGFAVPFMVSTGEGNYQVLFGYILILNTGILALAYFKKWSIINVLSYIFTVLLFGGWLISDLAIEQPHYLGALVFASAFYFLFVLINIIHNIRNKGSFVAVELGIIVSNTFLYFLGGMIILQAYRPELKGIFTLMLALLNFAYAWILYKKFGLDKKGVYLLIGLTLTFLTLTIPIQFEGNYITLFWAAEAIALLWLAHQSKAFAYAFISVLVMILATFSLMIDWKFYFDSEVKAVIINKVFLTGIFTLFAFFVQTKMLDKFNESGSSFGMTFNPKVYQKTLYFLMVFLGYFTGLNEVTYQVDRHILESFNQQSIIAIYHLLFTTVLFFFAMRHQNHQWKKLGIAIGVINILLFTFWFMNFANSESIANIAEVSISKYAYYMHLLMLIIIVYLMFSIYSALKNIVSIDWFRHKFFAWIFALFFIVFASRELTLQTINFSNIHLTEKSIINSGYSLDNVSEIDKIYLVEDYIIESVKTQIVKIGYPILWGILAFLFLIYGIKQAKKTYRIIALTLLGITVLKLFTYDISNVSETGKIIAFILLGILILIISFVYQKIKILVIDDQPKNE